MPQVWMWDAWALGIVQEGLACLPWGRRQRLTSICTADVKDSSRRVVQTGMVDGAAWWGLMARTWDEHRVAVVAHTLSHDARHTAVS